MLSSAKFNVGVFSTPCNISNPANEMKTRVLARCSVTDTLSFLRQARLGTKWKEYHGLNYWEGLLHPLDDTLRGEILRYGKFVEVTYTSFDTDPTSPSSTTCMFPEESMLSSCGLGDSGYQLTKYLYATSGIQTPRWFENLPPVLSQQSSWIGYVAVCTDEDEISRLGRRDIVIAYRGTFTCLEWLENFRPQLTRLCKDDEDDDEAEYVGPMVESGFLSLYTSSTDTCRSLRDEVKEEISRLLESYGDESLSLTITGHSLGGALAVLTAYDVIKTFDRPPFITVISFGAPRVGNRYFKHEVEKSGIRTLRVVNPQDIITKIPGFVVEDYVEGDDVHVEGNGVPRWILKWIDDMKLNYDEVGCELRVCSSGLDYPETRNGLGSASANFVTEHDIATYLNLVSYYNSPPLDEDDEEKIHDIAVLLERLRSAQNYIMSFCEEKLRELNLMSNYNSSPLDGRDEDKIIDLVLLNERLQSAQNSVKSFWEEKLSDLNLASYYSSSPLDEDKKIDLELFHERLQSAQDCVKSFCEEKLRCISLMSCCCYLPLDDCDQEHNRDLVLLFERIQSAQDSVKSFCEEKLRNMKQRF